MTAATIATMASDSGEMATSAQFTLLSLPGDHNGFFVLMPV